MECRWCGEKCEAEYCEMCSALIEKVELLGLQYMRIEMLPYFTLATLKKIAPKQQEKIPLPENQDVESLTKRMKEILEEVEGRLE